MKRLALIILSLSLAWSHFASAEDNPEKVQARIQKQHARQNAAVAKMAAANSGQARIMHGGNRGVPNAAANAQFRGQGHRPLNYPGMSAPARIRPSVVTPQRPQMDVNVRNGSADVALRRNGSDEANFRDRSHGNGNQDWHNRDRDGNQDWRDRDRGDNQDWKNRTWNNGQRDGGGRRHNWDRGHHDRNWYRSHYSRFARFGGGYYYWNSGFWYPAYGYDPYFSTYSYDAPVYAYNDLDPGQVIANVQEQLQRGGYYRGRLDGQFGPMTRQALLNYQSDNGLEPTGEIDEATLNSLGLQ